MPILLFVLLVILVATFGFWDTLAAIFGAALLAVLVVLLGVAAVGLGGYLLIKRRAGG
ncbi:MAG: hypothetical protein WD960_04295 [Gemmatimonadota bacterium]